MVGICGSTRQNSTNLDLLHAIAELEKDRIELYLFTDLASLPHFNPDDDHENVDASVSDFRQLLSESDGILICTPEYAMGVPGTLKNALDWTVSSMEFSHKPTALITASTLGEKAHQSLLETLRIIEADIDDTTALVISNVKIKVRDRTIIDPVTLNKVKAVMNALIEKIPN